MTASALLVATLSIISFVGGVRETSEKGDFQPANNVRWNHRQSHHPRRPNQKGTVIVAINTASQAELRPTRGWPSQSPADNQGKTAPPLQQTSRPKTRQRNRAKRIKQLEGLLDLVDRAAGAGAGTGTEAGTGRRRGQGREAGTGMIVLFSRTWS